MPVMKFFFHACLLSRIYLSWARQCRTLRRTRQLQRKTFRPQQDKTGDWEVSDAAVKAVEYCKYWVLQ